MVNLIKKNVKLMMLICEYLLSGMPLIYCDNMYLMEVFPVRVVWLICRIFKVNFRILGSKVTPKVIPTCYTATLGTVVVYSDLLPNYEPT